ncbi:dimethylsulfonioproprionate lyase family protein [Dongia sp.]|uniref:dimethylsulfonioproprionate lyase family protein n=1 Tax=Dongia sp. TaxID=1977262 RepID=UPI0035B27565
MSNAELWQGIGAFLEQAGGAPGLNEVRARLHDVGDLAVAIAQRPPNQPLCGYLSEALSVAHAGPGAALAALIGRSNLHWESYGAYAPGTIGTAFPRRHAYASLIADADPNWHRDVDLGFLLIAPHTLYRDHHHPARELYLPLTGPSYWRFGVDSKWQEKAAGAVIWNEPNRVHATLVQDVPLLCLYAWTENVLAPAVVDVASDWTSLESQLASR